VAHDLVDRLGEAGLVGGRFVGLPVLDLVQELDQLRRPNQAADVGGQDAIGIAGHKLSSVVGGG